MRNCDLCPRYCHVDRFQGVKGAICRTGELAVVHSFAPHHGEEQPLRGWSGSGTIFFSHCNLRCVYCQNWDISHKGMGQETSAEKIADMMLTLQHLGCHNINFVSPSHVVAQTLEAILLAAENGLHLPLVYNTGGYDSLEALKLLDGIIDIYMPDMKYADAGIARDFSRIKGYPTINQPAVKEMHRQVGDLILNEQGIAKRGLLIRHLVLPNGLAGTEELMAFIAQDLSRDTYINIMAQYHPCYRADEHPSLDRPINLEEYRQAVEIAHRHGLYRLDCAA